MANDPFYDHPFVRASVMSNAVFGKFASQPSRLYMDEASDLRRFTVVRPAATGKTQPIDQAALEQLREYLMLDLVCSGIVRTDKLPPLRQSIIELHVAVICANWAA